MSLIGKVRTDVPCGDIELEELGAGSFCVYVRLATTTSTLHSICFLHCTFHRTHKVPLLTAAWTTVSLDIIFLVQTYLGSISFLSPISVSNARRVAASIPPCFKLAITKCNPHHHTATGKRELFESSLIAIVHNPYPLYHHQPATRIPHSSLPSTAVPRISSKTRTC